MANRYMGRLPPGRELEIGFPQRVGNRYRRQMDVEIDEGESAYDRKALAPLRGQGAARTCVDEMPRGSRIWQPPFGPEASSWAQLPLATLLHHLFSHREEARRERRNTLPSIQSKSQPTLR